MSTFCTEKLSTSWSVWDKLTCSQPISVLKFLHVNIINAENDVCLSLHLGRVNETDEGSLQHFFPTRL